VSIPRRLGRIARGLVSNLQEDERFRETLRTGRERGEALRGAFEAALRGATEEWRSSEQRRAAGSAAGSTAGRAAEEQRGARERTSRGPSDGWRPSSAFPPRRYPPNVLAAYDRLGLMPGASIEEVDKKRRELVKRYHPDRFSEPEKRARAERITAEINAAHDAIERHLLRR
jgi:DnaJ-domain-containing protein 1